MAVAAKEAWITNQGFGVASISRAFVNAPAADDLLVCWGFIGATATRTISVSDDMTDGGTWTLAVGPVRNAAIGTGYVWAKKVGATANSNKTVTVSIDSGTDYHEIMIGSYTGANSSTPDGTSSVTETATNPNAGNVTLATDGVVLGFVSKGSESTAGSGFTVQFTNSSYNFNQVEDKIVAAGTYACDWANANSSGHIAIGACYGQPGAGTTRGMPFGTRGTAFNGGRTFVGIIR